MRTAQRNMTAFWYRLYFDKEELTDEYGNATGEYAVCYTAPVKAFANISPATGASSIEQFGTLENYDKVLVTTDMTLPIDEDSVLYIDTLPVQDETTHEWSPHDYLVKRVAKSINGISVAVSKVKVGRGDEPCPPSA